MRVKVGSVSFLRAAGSGYGIGLDDDGHLIEFLGDWRELAELGSVLGGPRPTYIEVDDWQVLAIDEELRLPLTPEGLVERAHFIRAALDQRSSTP
jgi:hypothetical protein